MATLLPLSSTNTITLVSLTDSKLLHVSVYAGRAELRRLFNFSVQTGQNQLYINGLPNVIQDDSLRVQGHGNAAIHDVSLLYMPQEPAETTSPLLEQLLARKELVQSAISRCQTSSRALEGYICSMTVAKVSMILGIAVSSASWEAVYDIRVELEAKKNTLTLVYRAALFQDTGEDWIDVPLTLETAMPSYGVQIPKLKSLKLLSILGWPRLVRPKDCAQTFIW
ncbi:hypothetical protein GYMLUDRAFT_668311 [Collybiopsis luxurians FD-317 M1]|uniref:DUF4139 domain-containing protein n=1 Tax=Collybiopsis luxurians FD-317 M1 TaxID=944289 RepID=A0A0D0CLL0_9AGAR|nr:hypothetical protein GYMLUDRAFT_668311 [Collybiopsis luxurians FD-317 M1]